MDFSVLHGYTRKTCMGEPSTFQTKFAMHGEQSTFQTKFTLWGLPGCI